MKIIFHIGFFKTATTFLEDNFYSRNEHINYLNISNKYEIVKILHFIKNSTPKQYNSEYKKFYSLVKKLKWSKKKINVISAVGLTDVLSQNDISLDLSVILSRIKSLYSFKNKNKIKILLTYREQKSYILSRYAENIDYFIKIKKTWSNFQKFQKDIYKVDVKKKTKEKYFFESLKYFLILQKCSSIFGKKNIKFINYKLLQSNKKLFLKNIYRFIGIKYNKNLELFYHPKNISKKIDNEYFLKGPKIKKILMNNIENKNLIEKFLFRKIKNFFFIILNIIFFNLNNFFMPQKIKFDEKFEIKIRQYYKLDNQKLREMKRIVIT